MDLVRREASAQIHEAQPDLDLTQLPAWAQDPSAAPALSDRACEQLMNLAIAEAAAGHDAQAQGLVRLVRAKARNRNNAFVGSTLLSELARRGAAAGEDQAGVRTVLAELPRNRFGMATVVFQLFQNAGQVQARLAQVHAQLVSLDTAVAALTFETLLLPIVEHRPVFMAAIEEVRTAQASQPETPPYAFSTVDLTRVRDAQPVVVAVWDTGVATSLFPSQLFTNEREQANGTDDDGDGVVDDIHGIASDPTPGQTELLYQPGDEVIHEYASFLRGIMDLRAGLGSSEAAQRVLALMAGAQDAEAVDRLEENLDKIGEWAHGTHVAGLLLAGLPQARLAVFRSAWAGEARLYHHRGPTDEELGAERTNIEQIAAFIRANHVRVVNASLGFSRDYLEDELRHESGRYHDDAEVRARAHEIHARRMGDWHWLFEQCPDTLFVVAAGNSNRDVVEYQDFPASFDLPNLLAIGAVDRFGQWATFTSSSPERVRVFDFGVEVESVIPNGERVPLSGTSMASPNAANLAAKMISLDPRLTPHGTIMVMQETGDAIAAPFYGRIVNEERALARVRRDRRHTR